MNTVQYNKTFNKLRYIELFIQVKNCANHLKFEIGKSCQKSIE